MTGDIEKYVSEETGNVYTRPEWLEWLHELNEEKEFQERPGILEGIEMLEGAGVGRSMTHFIPELDVIRYPELPEVERTLIIGIIGTGSVCIINFANGAEIKILPEMVDPLIHFLQMEEMKLNADKFFKDEARLMDARFLEPLIRDIEYDHMMYDLSSHINRHPEFMNTVRNRYRKPVIRQDIIRRGNRQSYKLYKGP